MPKHLTITYDGKLAISGYGTLCLGDTALSSIVAHAFDVNGTEHKEVSAEVFISIRLKDDKPIVQWEDARC